jgi:FtsH-binding integral membrane protein
LQKIANRITLGLVVAALIVGAALLMRIETSFRIFGYPGLAMIFFLLAAAAGLVLVVSILFYDERPDRKKE